MLYFYSTPLQINISNISLEVIDLSQASVFSICSFRLLVSYPNVYGSGWWCGGVGVGVVILWQMVRVVPPVKKFVFHFSMKATRRFFKAKHELASGLKWFINGIQWGSEYRTCPVFKWLKSVCCCVVKWSDIRKVWSHLFIPLENRTLSVFPMVLYICAHICSPNYVT